MKVCPKCLKTYDDDWGVCLDCEARLEKCDNEQDIEAVGRKRAEREKIGIQLCSMCHNEFPADKLSKPKHNKSMLWGWGAALYAVSDAIDREGLVCSECDKKKYDRQNKIKYAIYSLPFIFVGLFFLMLFLSKLWSK